MKRSVQALGVLFVVVALGLVGAAPAQALTKAQTQLLPVGGPYDVDLDDPYFIPLQMGVDYEFANQVGSLVHWPGSGIPSDADPGIFNTKLDVNWFGTVLGGVNVPTAIFGNSYDGEYPEVNFCLVMVFARVGQGPSLNQKTTPLFSAGEAGYVLNSFASNDPNFLGVHGGIADPTVFFDGPGTNLFANRMGNNLFGVAFRGVVNHATNISYNWAIFENQVSPGQGTWQFADMVLQVKVPEPSSALLMGATLLGLLAVGRRVRRSGA